MSKYDDIITKVFFDNHKNGSKRVSFLREELAVAGEELGFDRIKNLGDIPYSYRFRKGLPEAINDTINGTKEWIIVGAGIAQYEFRIAYPSKVSPSLNRKPIVIPDATPEIIKKYAAGTDEQALLTKIRYNRLVDLFLGLTCYSVQNHLRTTVDGIGQIEVDEIYIGLNSSGVHFSIPCQAKSPGDSFGIVQAMQDLSLCQSKYPTTVCRPLALQFLSENEVAIAEIDVREEDEEFKMTIVDEKNFKLVLKSDISEADQKKLTRRYGI
jgi:hypothetical protein